MVPPRLLKTQPEVKSQKLLAFSAT